MSIQLGSQQITKSYTESKEERTKEIVIRTKKGQDPEITVTREILTYQDDVLVSSEVTKIFKITLADLALADKTAVVQAVADTIDAIAPSK